jgi:pseudouridine-5'-phosphate glycosidase/pseudouridine kinase
MARSYLHCLAPARISRAFAPRQTLISSALQCRCPSSPVVTLERGRFASTWRNANRPPPDPYFKVSEEVLDAQLSNEPVVALETTIYTHGFPYPDNVALALELESIVRRNGGIPATIGIVDGIARVGLSTEELVALTSNAGNPDTMKVSRRDIPYIIGMVSGFPRLFLVFEATVIYSMHLALDDFLKSRAGYCWAEATRRHNNCRHHVSCP